MPRLRAQSATFSISNFSSLSPVLIKGIFIISFERDGISSLIPRVGREGLLFVGGGIFNFQISNEDFVQEEASESRLEVFFY